MQCLQLDSLNLDMKYSRHMQYCRQKSYTLICTKVKSYNTYFMKKSKLNDIRVPLLIEKAQVKVPTS